MHIEEFPSCCGALILGELDPDDYETICDFDTEPEAFFATTVPQQKQEIALLKSKGFKTLTSWKNPNTGRVITVWFCKPKTKAQLKRSANRISRREQEQND